MLYFFDSSALVKRYHAETGSPAIDEIFTAPVEKTLTLSSLSLCEVVSAFNRAGNRGEISNAEIVIAMTRFYSDILNRTLSIVDITRAHIVRASELILQHNLRPHDAVILSCAMDMQQFNPVFVASDGKLFAAARERHFRVMNPEDPSR